MLLTFEGIDGCGKTTQIKSVKSYFERLGREVLSLREPGGTNFSEQIREILLYSKDKISARAELLLFEAARANLVETVVKPALSEGKVVICDRFYDSTTAYQGFGRGLPIEEINQANMIATGGLTPDATFYLYVTLETARMRSHHRYADRIESAGDAFFERVVAGFAEISRLEPERVYLVDANGTIEQTFRKIENILNKKMSNS